MSLNLFIKKATTFHGWFVNRWNSIRVNIKRKKVHPIRWGFLQQETRIYFCTPIARRLLRKALRLRQQKFSDTNDTFQLVFGILVMRHISTGILTKLARAIFRQNNCWNVSIYLLKRVVCVGEFFPVVVISCCVTTYDNFLVIQRSDVHPAKRIGGAPEMVVHHSNIVPKGFSRSLNFGPLWREAWLPLRRQTKISV